MLPFNLYLCIRWVLGPQPFSNYWIRLLYGKKNLADLGGCYLPQPSASANN